MSDIFVPTLGVLSPKYIDGLENLVIRTAGLTTNALAFATIAQVDILPNTFGNDKNNARLELEFYGQTVGIAGNKQFRSQVDAVTVYTPASANSTTNPGSFWIKLITIFRNGQAIHFMRTMFGDGATGNLVINSMGGSTGGFANFDPTIAHSMTIQALVANAADSIRCDLIGGSFR